MSPSRAWAASHPRVCFLSLGAVRRRHIINLIHQSTLEPYPASPSKALCCLFHIVVMGGGCEVRAAPMLLRLLLQTAESREQKNRQRQEKKHLPRQLCNSTGKIRTGPGRNVGRPPCCMACGVAARRVPGSQSDRLSDRQSSQTCSTTDASQSERAPSQTPTAEPASQ